MNAHAAITPLAAEGVVLFDATRNPRRRLTPEDRRAIWDMAATGASAPTISAAHGICADRVRHALRCGRPDGASWHDLSRNDVRSSLRAIADAVGFVAIVNAAARRWGCPASAILGCDSRSHLRFRPVAAARAEACWRLRHAGLSLPECEALLRLTTKAVMIAQRRFETRAEFADLRAEMAGGAA